MKFILQTISKCSGRLGYLCEIERLPGFTVETPHLLMYTKGGSVPHLTHEVLQMVSQDPLSIQLPLPSIIHCEEAVSEFKEGIANFIGLGECLTYCTIQDPGTSTIQGFNEKDVVSIFSRSGKQQLNPDKYMNIMESFCPDMYQVLCDGNTNLESSKKRVQKAVARSSSFFEKCIERHEKSQALQNSALLGVIEGGYNIIARETCAKEMSQRSVSGFVIDGLHNNGPDVESLAFENVKNVIEATLKHLPEHKFRIVHGCWNPEAVLDLVELGIDIFDSSYPFIVSERGSALVFCNQIDTSEIPADTASRTSVETNSNNIQDSNKICQGGEVKKKVVSSKYEISLKNKRYFDDFDPICKSCNCLTCSKHTRAYINHLLNTQELLASVLLMIHNTHHYLKFFKSIRSAVKENKLNMLRTCVSR